MFAFLAARPALAQDLVELEPEDLARFHTGPLHFTPSISVTNLGVDSNVFNESNNEKSDRTAAVGPAVDYWARLGRSRLAGRSFGQYLYFGTYENQRSWNTGHNLRAELRLTRLKPFVLGSYLNTRERPGFEIDSRARRTDTMLGLGTDIQLSGRTTLVVGANRATIAFDQNETFLGSALATSLDRDTYTEQLQMRYAMTPLTTFVVTTDLIQDRFVFSSDRDGDSVRVTGGFEFKPSALVSGKVAIGQRHLNAFDPATPDYDGLVASVDTIYTIARTLVGFRMARDLAYSYQVQRPYYALNDTSLSVTERITANWDLVGRAGWQRLAYSTLDTSILVADRTDKGRLYGGGVGYLIGEVLRVGFDVNHYQRISPASLGQSYEGFRMGASISYGSTQ